MPIVLHEAKASDHSLCIQLLHSADEDDNRIREALADSANTTFIAFDVSSSVGAAMMRWQGDEAEIVYIAVAEDVRGIGYGKQIINALIKIARTRKIKSVVVGTANSSLDNIVFYQKCGFRIDHVRRDYFSYFSKPVMDNGILIRDMLVFRMELD